MSSETGAVLSLKENMEVLKEELSSEEKFFESAIRTERFVKRYQKPLIAVIAASLLAVGGAIGYQAYSNAKQQSSNAAFNLLLANPADTKAQETLKNDNPALYDVWRLSRGITQSDVSILESLKNSKSFGVADIASYESAAIKGDIASLDQYTKKQGSLYKDLALLELAVSSIEKGDIAIAHEKLALINDESPLHDVVVTLMHYGVK